MPVYPSPNNPFPSKLVHNLGNLGTKEVKIRKGKEESGGRKKMKRQTEI